MPAVVIDGKTLAESIKQRVQRETERLKKKGIVPGLAVILVGENPASKVYVNRKAVSCAEAGIQSTVFRLPENESQQEVLEQIQRLNADSRVHGILVQLPLPKQLDETEILQAVLPEKDVDGFHFSNQGKLFSNQNGLFPNTAQAVIQLIESTGTKISGQHAVVVGRSLLVGKPAALLLLQKDATITVCHSKTKNLAEQTKKADIVVVATGKPGLITKGMVKKGAVVIDVGTTSQNGKLVGDVDFEAVKEIASFITPVPGGVGPMTVACLLENTLRACAEQAKRGKKE